MYTLDSSLTYPWASYCGIPGGIPTRTTVYATMTTANTIGEINAAIAACTAGQVVAFAAGTYNISGISRKSGITVRGAGAGQTIINSGGSNAFNYTGNSFNYDSGHQAIASGYTKGSLSITMATTPGAQFVVGRLIMINQDDDLTLVFPRTGNWAGTRNLRHVSLITDITGNVITFSTPLPYTFVAAQNPGAQAVACLDSLFGVENMTIDAASCVRFLGSDRCWVKDCEIRGFDNEGIFCRDSHQLEIRRCYIHDCDGFPSQSDGYGLYAQYAVSCLRMEDCIGYHIAYGTVMNGNDSSAYLYNYMKDMGRDAATRFWQQPGFNCNHGPHSMMNLWEGNSAERWQNDAYHGSASHQTLFRNNIHGVNASYTLDRRIMDFCRTSYYFNVVGNIIGDSTWNPNYYEYPATTYDRTHGTIYLLGWPNMGSGSLTEETALTGFTPPGGSYPDTNVAATLTRHANFDYYNDAVQYSDADHDIANSLFYDAKPAYFGALAWPPIGPEVGGYVTPTPAKARWDAYVVSEDIADLFADQDADTTPATYTIAVVPSSKTVSRGASAAYDVTVNADAGFTDNVTLGVTGLPVGVTPTFATNPVAPNATTTLTIPTSALDVQTYNLKVTGE